MHLRRRVRRTVVTVPPLIIMLVEWVRSLVDVAQAARFAAAKRKPISYQLLIKLNL